MTKSEKSIFDSLLVLTKTRSLQDITANEIIQKAKVSKRTFYKYFYDKFDVANKFFEHILYKNRMELPKNMTWRDVVVQNAVFFKKYDDFLKNTKFCQDVNSLAQFFFNDCKKFYTSVVERGGGDINDTGIKRAIKALSVIATDIFTGKFLDSQKYDITKSDMPTEEVIQILLDVMPAKIAKYFE